MKNPQKIIIYIIFILLVIIVGIFIIIINKKNEVFEYTPIEEIELVKTLEEVSIRNSYYAIYECINKFYSYYIAMFNIEDYYGTESEEVKKELEQENAIILYNMLDEEYINAKEVTNDNIKTKLSEIKNSMINITNMYVSEQSDNIEVYIVKGILLESESKEKKEFEIIVKVDVVNESFSIIPQEYVKEKYNSLEEGKEPEIVYPETIERNENNIIYYKDINNEEYIKKLFNQFKFEIQNLTEIAYESLDEEYRNKRFGTVERFKEYLNKKKYPTMQLEKYQVKNEEDYIQYVCIDQEGNYYIFREKSIMNYSLILDTYTIDLPEFVEKYNEVEYNEKVLLNMEKIINATNAEDYRYVYGKLDNTFKSTKFKTQEDFEKYIKERYDSADTIEYNGFEQVNNTFIYNIEVTDVSENNVIDAKIVMQLGEGTDFIMSFSTE